LKRRTDDNVEEGNIGTLEDFYYKEDGQVDIIRSHGEMHLKIMEVLKKRSVIALQDDYSNWMESDKKRGKLLMVDRSDYNTH